MFEIVMVYLFIGDRVHKHKYKHTHIYICIYIHIYIYIYRYIYIYQVGFGRKREVFSMKEIHVEPPFLYDHIRNGYCKPVITSTAESKSVFFFLFRLLNHKLHAENED